MSSQSSCFGQPGSPTIVELEGAVCHTLRPRPEWIPNTCIPVPQHLSMFPEKQEGIAPAKSRTGTDTHTRHKQELLQQHFTSATGLSAYDQICAEAKREQYYLQHLIVDEVEQLDRESSMRDETEKTRDSEDEREDLDDFSALAWWSEVAVDIAPDREPRGLLASDSRSAASSTVVPSGLGLSVQPMSKDDGLLMWDHPFRDRGYHQTAS